MSEIKKQTEPFPEEDFMKIATAVYKKYLAAQGVRRSVWSFMRTVLIRLFDDPICYLPIHGQFLKLPLSHALPDYLNQLPFYDRLPKRVSEYIHSKIGSMTCVDVGANIGDSIASFYRDETDIFLAIEPNPKFNRILVKNWGWNKNVTVTSCMCSDHSNEGTFEIDERSGTASIFSSENGIQMIERPLDEIIAQYPFATTVNVVKIDTDGYDFKVIAGAQGLLSANHPAILFECVDMENPNYVEECLKILQQLKQIGYNQLLLYDNYGYLMGKYSLSNLYPLRNLFFYQLTSRFHYFDMLCMKDEDIAPFYSSEIQFFVDNMPNKMMNRTAFFAANQ